MRSIHSINKLQLSNYNCYEEENENKKNTTYFHSNNSLIYTSQFHATYGSIMLGRYFSSGTGYAYGFNGKENDNEVKGIGNQVVFEARIYDSRLGRWLSADQLEPVYPAFSPYAFSFNNPIILNDLDGKIGRVAIKGNKAIVSQNFYFYGTGITKKEAKSIAKGIAKDWNSANASINIDGKRYKVKFNIKGYAISKEDAVEKIKTASDEDNFIAIGSSNANAAISHFDGNTGWWNRKQHDKTKTIYSHENSHGLGMHGHPDVDEKTNEIIDPTIIDEINDIIPIRLPQTAKNNGVQIDATKRKVMQSDIDILNIPDAILNNKGVLGGKDSNQTIYNEDGSPYSDKYGVLPSPEEIINKKSNVKPDNK